MNLNNYNHCVRLYSITNKQLHSYNETLKNFENVVDSSPYIETWSEYQRLNKLNPKILYKLEFHPSLNITNQIYASVSDHLYQSNLQTTIVQQSIKGIIIKIPKLEKEVLDKWYYESYNEKRDTK